MGAAKAAEMIGVHTNTVNKGVRENNIAKAVEVAARGIYERDQKANGNGVNIFVSCDRSTYALIAPFLDKFGAQHIELKF